MDGELQMFYIPRVNRNKDCRILHTLRLVKNYVLSQLKNDENLRKIVNKYISSPKCCCVVNFSVSCFMTA